MPLVPSNDMKRSLEIAMMQFHKSVDLAMDYLSSRGITKEAVNYFRLGFVADGIRPPWDEFAGRLAIPYIVGRSVVGFKFRALDDEGLRYISNHGFYAKRFFNPQTLTELHSRIYICEGELDTITLWQLGVPAVGLGGANTWDPWMGRALRGREVIVLADGKGRSEKGKNAGRNLAKEILATVEEGGRIVLEDSDVNQFYLSHGRDALLEEIGWSNG